MNNNFIEKLNQYKADKLNENEKVEIEDEINKFIAIQEYIDEEEDEFIKGLKIQKAEENNFAKNLKYKVNSRIIITTGIAIIVSSIIIITLLLLLSRITSSLFGLSMEEDYVERATIMQFVEIFQPKYKVISAGSYSSIFAQQAINASLEDTLGHNIIDDWEMEVKYSFGKPTKRVPEIIPDFLYINDLPSEAFLDFDTLEKAPDGTKAKVFVVFTKELTAQDMKDEISDQLNVEISYGEITPVAGYNEKLLIGNPNYFQYTPEYPYNENSDQPILEGNLYDKMDNVAHTESFIGNLNLIKDNTDLLKVMYYDDMFESTNIDNIIEEVKNHGVRYIGMYISADTKELLKLKDNSLIKNLFVKEIVIW